MSKYYNPHRSRNLYNPKSSQPFRISRSKIDLFLECPRCFYLDRRLGVARPPGYPFSLNSAVDALLKKEFDVHRAQATAHPLMKAYRINAVPYQHPDMDKWRDSLRHGVEHLHPKTGLMITGGVDDIWVNEKEELHVVDYKATAKDGEVTLDAEWQIGYKRQMEVYQWLLRQNDFAVSETGYFVYANGKLDAEAFDGKLEFDVKVIGYDGDDGWVGPTLLKLNDCLRGENIPESGDDCDYCTYRGAVASVEREPKPTKKKDTLF